MKRVNQFDRKKELETTLPILWFSIFCHIYIYKRNIRDEFTYKFRNEARRNWAKIMKQPDCSKTARLRWMKMAIKLEDVRIILLPSVHSNSIIRINYNPNKRKSITKRNIFNNNDTNSIFGAIEWIRNE